MEFLLIPIWIIALAAVALWLYVARQGDAEFDFLVDQRTNFKLNKLTGDSAEFSCKVPFVNKGTQDGTIMDCYPRHLLPYEQFDAVEVYSRIELEDNPRTDGYFEALIVPKTAGGSIVLTVKFTAKQGDIREALKDMVDMSVDLVYQVVARGDWYITKQRLVMPAEEVSAALQEQQAGA